MRNRRWWWTGGTLVVVALGAAVALKAGGKAPAETGKAEVALEFTPKEVAQPQPARLGSRLEFSGALVAPSTAVVRAKAPGTLLALAVAEGSRVQPGQALGRIDLAEQTSRVAERHAGVESARAALAQAERTHASNVGLAAQQFISAVALDNSRATVEAARATLAAAQASADTARLGLRDGTLLAPIGGIVAKRHALPGEKLAMEQPVLTLVDLATLELLASVGTHEVSRLAPGQAVQVQVEGVAQPLAGRIARIAPAAEPGTRSIGVAIELPNPGERLRAGQYAVARLDLPGEAERLTLPLAAVGQDAGQDHVWVIDGGKLARRGVTLGRRDEREGRVEVLEGLSPGAQVLAARFDNLREGARASVVAAKGPPVASAAASMPVVR